MFPRNFIGTTWVVVRADEVQVDDWVAQHPIVWGDWTDVRQVTRVETVGDDVVVFVDRQGITVEWFTTSIGNAVMIAAR